MQVYNRNQLNSRLKIKLFISEHSSDVFVIIDGTIIGKGRKKGRNLSLSDTGNNSLENWREQLKTFSLLTIIVQVFYMGK